jgi:hypothetical protein
MNSNSQLDLHPDAESLNAFAEQALPEGERGQVLAHLAACSRCRQVVYLAQEAASELEMSKAADFRPEMDRAAAYGFAAAMAAAPVMAAAIGPAGDRKPGKRSGWRSWGWRLAWVPTAVLTAIIGLAVFVHVRQVRPGFESGSKPFVVLPQSAPQQQAKATEPSPEGKAVAGFAQPATPPVTAKAPAEKARTATALAPSEALSAAAAPAATPPTAAVAMEMSSSELNEARSLPEAQRQAVAAQANAALFKQAAPGTGASSPERVVGANSFNAANAGATSTMHGTASRVQASRSVSAAALAPQSEMKSATLGSFEVTGKQLTEPTAEILAAHKAKTVVLPNGLRAVSIVTAQLHTLAIDRFGTLFLSQDSGGHWEPVTRQWSGRAVEVRIQESLNVNGTAAAGAKAGSAEGGSNGSSMDRAVAPPVMFEMVNDSDLVWVSTDGKTWNAK